MACHQPNRWYHLYMAIMCQSNFLIIYRYIAELSWYFGPVFAGKSRNFLCKDNGLAPTLIWFQYVSPIWSFHIIFQNRIWHWCSNWWMAWEGIRANNLHSCVRNQVIRLEISINFSSNNSSYTSYFTGLDLVEWPGDINFAIVQASPDWVGWVTFQCNGVEGKTAVEIIILRFQIVYKIQIRIYARHINDMLPYIW